MRVLAIDIGGSSVKSAVVSVSNGKFKELTDARVTEIGGRNFAELFSVVRGIVSSAEGGSQWSGCIGISTTGSVSENGTVLKAGHFEDYSNVSWGELLAEATPRPRSVSVLNDGRAATIAEYALRCEEGPLTFVHVVVGTGVGCGLVIAGDLHHGDSGVAGNLGHIKITPNPTRKCSCGSTGCLEVLAAGPAVASHYEALLRGNKSAINVDVITGFRAVVDSAKSGSSEAIASLRAAGEWLGRGLSFAINLLNPSEITLGGGLLDAGAEIESKLGFDPYFESAVITAKVLAHPRPSGTVKISRAHYGNDGGMIGAALYAEERARSATAR